MMGVNSRIFITTGRLMGKPIEISTFNRPFKSLNYSFCIKYQSGGVLSVWFVCELQQKRYGLAWGINVELVEIAARKWLNGEVWYIYWIVLKRALSVKLE